MAFLSGWNSANRYRIDVASANIDSNLTHFAVPLKISTSSGTGSADISAIFDELGANSLKITDANVDSSALSTWLVIAISVQA